MDDINQVVTDIDKGQQESQNWRNELPQLQQQLDSLVAQQQGQAKADVMEALAITSNDVQSLAQDSIKLAGLTGDQLIADFGTEVRCNADFVHTRVSTGLTDLATRLKFWQDNKHTWPPLRPHSVCHLTPSDVELHPTGNGGWAMDSPPLQIVRVYGYDFNRQSLPAVELHDQEDHKLRDASVTVNYVTRYEIDLDFATETFTQVGSGSHYVLQWPDQPEPNAISVTLNIPAVLNIVDASVQPSTPRAQVDPVDVRVDVVNSGGSNSGAFVITWLPGPNETMQSATIANLQANAKATYHLSGYRYQNDGTFDSVITVANGAPTHISVNVTPYANNPKLQYEQISGVWKGGGNPDDPDKTDFNLPSITLPAKGCVIDTSRGGEGMTVGNHLISWPAGYDFQFSTDNDTIWASLDGVSVNFDGQAVRATPTVALKGLGGHGWIPSRGEERFKGTFTVYSKCP